MRDRPYHPQIGHDYSVQFKVLMKAWIKWMFLHCGGSSAAEPGFSVANMGLGASFQRRETNPIMRSLLYEDRVFSSI
jgi:hypothetical protein